MDKFSTNKETFKAKLANILIWGIFYEDAKFKVYKTGTIQVENRKTFRNQ